jgi:hypothetical protein
MGEQDYRNARIALVLVKVWPLLDLARSGSAERASRIVRARD